MMSLLLVNWTDQIPEGLLKKYISYVNIYLSIEIYILLKVREILTLDSSDLRYHKYHKGSC